MTTTADTLCPTCLAKPGAPCTTIAGRPVTRVHNARALDRARAAAVRAAR